MKTYKEILQERTENKIYKVEDELWVAYAQGSGQTFKVKSSYITDKSGDENENKQLVRKFVEYAKNNKPIKAKDDLYLYELPIYNSSNVLYDSGKDLDVWGGTQKPVKNEYYVVSIGNTSVITFFETKKEALNWLKYTA
jgi:hypothetical protein